jgi:hypothetical protein
LRDASRERINVIIDLWLYAVRAESVRGSHSRPRWRGLGRLPPRGRRGVGNAAEDLYPGRGIDRPLDNPGVRPDARGLCQS